MQRSDSELIGKRSDELYVDGRFGLYRDTDDPNLNDDDDLYGNRYAERLYSNSGLHGNGECLTKRTGELSRYL